jgi:hypothetical protein
MAFVERPFGKDPVKVQVAKGAFMSVFGSLVFVVRAIFLTAHTLIGCHHVGAETELERTCGLGQ